MSRVASRCAALPQVESTRVLRRERRGSSLPVIVDSPSGAWFTKLHGASQGVAPLIAEVIVAELAEAIGLSVPPRVLVTLPAAVPSDDINDELRDLLDASAGLNLGFTVLEAARDLTAAEVPGVDLYVAARVLWLDTVVQNFDRSLRNPNLMIRRGTIWLIDHGAALPFHHDWSAVTDAHAVRPYDVTGHLFGWVAPLLDDAHAQLAPLLSREVLAGAVDMVPDRWLGTDPVQRRADYVRYLSARLAALRGLI
ncbi:MAG: hypothetical protein P3C10_01115 [Gemmatimonadota bacterium]|nr:hypothetical protein [Gemmatimonadota bacterium]